MPQPYTFNTLLNEFRNTAASERDKGDRFERLIKNYLLTDPVYETVIEQVYLWEEFPFRDQFGGTDIGIDLVTKNYSGEYWAVQCKCYQANAYIDKASVDSFLSTSARSFKNEAKQSVKFAERLWVSTTNNWSANAEETLKNQDPPVSRINLTNLNEAAVDWTQIANGVFGKQARITQKTLRPHQTEALNATITSFKTAERGKLIMACGTGKTFTSLKIAEAQAPANGLVLFLVPSIALLGQTLREWTAESERPIQAICICSDARVSRQKVETDDGDDSVVDLAMPASTNVKTIVRQLSNRQNRTDQLTVVFSTYQSIEVIAEAQRAYITEYGSDSGVFDLIICDEAHRTTGVTVADTDESAFVKVHDNSFIQSRKRLYMTATPRLFDDNSKAKAALNEAELCSMDDEALYGEELYRIGFGEAVGKGLLSDYKVLILTLKEGDVPLAVQKMLANDEAEITTDDASKLIGCINAMSKKLLGDNKVVQETDPQPMRRAVAFCRSIKDSENITNTFNATQGVYHDELPEDERSKTVNVFSKHIDGTMNAPTRDEMLAWLKEPTDDPMDCRVLTNVRCLSEGVDVPSLDAVLFLSARNSQVDVVQSVGRVMRKAPGKNFGYIIIPVIVPSNVEADKALDNNERFRVVWTVLNALRAHDDRFNAIVNKIELNKQRPSQILMTRPDTAYATEYGEHPNERNQTVAEQQEAYQRVQDEINQQLALQFEELQGIVFAKLVKKVGDRRYWETWAKDVAIIAEQYIERITRLIAKDDTYRTVFENFLTGLRKNINPAISEGQAIEMLAQHIITKPVFDALFEGYSFVENNAISVAMQQMVTLLEEQTVEKDTETLDKFYDSVRKRASGIDNAEGKQRIIIELYDKFFKTAFPKMVEQLGIVYTPVEVVDFIIHSVNDVLKKEFGRSISDENVHVLDPFTGTGTFITRLLQSGLIEPKDLPRKYKHELHANELVLLAYYIAAVNIENAYHDAMLQNTPLRGELEGVQATAYESFDGICLTDTFQLGETDGSDELFSDVFPKNSKRVEQQKKAPLRVIMGNPPYSVGQKSANDNAQNQSYDVLDARIANTYAKASDATNKNALYDSYIKAFRWSTDRLDPVHGGVIAFVSNGAWLDGNSTAGFRKTLEQEFDSIYVFDLRGNQRTSGELSRKEGGKIFGSGSRTPIAITILVKKGK